MQYGVATEEDVKANLNLLGFGQEINLIDVWVNKLINHKLVKNCERGLHMPKFTFRGIFVWGAAT